jgi:cation diffusion facilitator family transporter
LTALKLAAYLGTGALVLLMEALHSLTDVVVAALLLIAARRSAQNPPRRWGYGSALNLAGLVAAILFTALPVVLLLEGAIPRLLDPAEYRDLPLAAGVVLLSMVLTAAPVGGLLVQRPRGRLGDVRLVELLTDLFCLLVTLAAVLLVRAGYPEADPIAAIAIAPVIIVNGVALFRENANVLVRRSPGTAFLRQVERLARSVTGVLGVHDLRAEQVGSGAVRAVMHIEVPRGLPIEEADRIAHVVEQRVQAATGCQGCVIHMDPARAPDATPPG